ncbi:hypothetical protein Tco_0145617 [Tanacetum coccineum]
MFKTVFPRCGMRVEARTYHDVMSQFVIDLERALLLAKLKPVESFVSELLPEVEQQGNFLPSPSSCSWVSPVHWVPKKGGITVGIRGEGNIEWIPTRLGSGWGFAWLSVGEPMDSLMDDFSVFGNSFLKSALPCDFAIGAVLAGKVAEKHFRPIATIASKSYLINDTSIVHSDHSAPEVIFFAKKGLPRRDCNRWGFSLPPEILTFKVIDTKGARILRRQL